MGTNDSNDNNSDDAKLFRDAMRDANPIKGPARVSHDQRPKPNLRKRIASQPHADSNLPKSATADSETGLGQRLTYKRNSVSRRMMRELSRGKIAVDATLDLHGLTSDAARTELERFLAECAHRGLRCIRIVHGKGLGSGSRGPVLKSMTNSCLQQTDAVLAFCSALDRDGGTGAVYALLSGR